jgi:benzoyl-CoA-dihydrodiol lyase
MVTLAVPAEAGPVDFETSPERYRHWKLSVAGRVATLALDVDEDAGLRPGYKLKLNSYDLGVDVELRDALDRIRFEHPEVATVVLTSAKDRSFCAGANIYMLGTSTHAWKVNFCKFTNETRNGMEDSSRHDGLKFVAAVNGACAGGGYEIALACDEILMIDDRSTTVSLPEVPLLGVLPGTGGLTRLTDKRKLRRDLADLFCTNADGVRAQRAKEWGLVDAIASPSEFAGLVQRHAQALADASPRGTDAPRGVTLHPLRKIVDANGLRYRHVEVTFDRAERTATLLLRAPLEPLPTDAAAIEAQGDTWWPLALARELDDALLWLRTNELELGLLLLRTEGDLDAVLAAGTQLDAHSDHWLVRETIGLLRRTLARLDVSSRSLYAIIDGGSCFGGLFLELALAADRSYMLDQADGEGPAIVLDGCNAGMFPMVNGRSRLATRFLGAPERPNELLAARAFRYNATDALAAGLVTIASDELDWDDEIRLAIEERAALSPDALTAMEANLRFGGEETMETRIFGRLSAWQNWVFIRPNATGEQGALTLFGTGTKPHFDRNRV